MVGTTLGDFGEGRLGVRRHDMWIRFDASRYPFAAFCRYSVEY